MENPEIACDMNRCLELTLEKDGIAEELEGLYCFWETLVE